MTKKAEWIYSQMLKGTDYDDVCDVLLGNITGPSSFVADVKYYAEIYDEEFQIHTRKLND